MHQEFKISRMAYGGEGIAHLDGKICFVENALPGETVLAQITENKAKFLRAKTVSVLTASPSRVSPPCPYANTCGGCQYQHVEYAEELKWKETQVREHLSRNLKIAPEIIRSITGSSSPYGYRNSVTLHTENGRTGFFANDNRTLVEIENCLLTAPGLRPVFKTRPARKSADRTFRISADGKIFSNTEDAFFEISAGKESFLTHSRSFFQNNAEITGKIAEKIRDFSLNPSPEIFADLYAGAGTFTLLSAPAGISLILAEESSWGLSALEKNLTRRGIRAEVLKGRVEKTFPIRLKNPDFKNAAVLVDPPRGGMAEELTKALAENPGVSRLVYLSCHLGTLTRDLGRILEKGRLKIREVLPFDMFPRTKHIEVLVFLS